MQRDHKIKNATTFDDLSMKVDFHVFIQSNEGTVIDVGQFTSGSVKIVVRKLFTFRDFVCGKHSVAFLFPRLLFPVPHTLPLLLPAASLA